MLILKGNSGKSRVVDTLMSTTNSICFEYYNYPIIYNAIWVDSREYSLEDFIECISDELEDILIKDKRYRYIFIHTNQEEKDVQKIIDWFENYDYIINCENIILTCS